MLFWALAEPLRLLAGWAGNLGENVPWLVIYCVLCLVPQSAVAYYLMLAAYVRVVVYVLCTKACRLLLTQHTRAACQSVGRSLRDDIATQQTLMPPRAGPAAAGPGTADCHGGAVACAAACRRARGAVKSS